MSAHVSDVKVFIRTRPTANFAKDLIQYLPDGQTVNIHLRKGFRKRVVNNQLCSWSFRMDRVFHDVSQEEMYASVARSVVLGALDGYNGTVMCFGQTGAGKTYTMTGATKNYKERGIIPRALQEVFREVEKRTNHAISVYLSFLEIYNETLVDLLSSVPLEESAALGGMSIVEEAGGGVFVRGLSLHQVHSEEEALNLLFEGDMNRIIGAHTLNRNSSRSHCILSIHIESRARTLSEAKFLTSKLSLVDLAGSERLGKSGSEGQLLKEATYINKSLSFLEQAILALADRRREHVPFRQSKLTHALKDCLGGNCNTVLVANIYGEAGQIEETLSTLRFAGRMKRVQTEPAINEHVDPVIQVRKLQKEVELLKQELFIHDSLANRMRVSYDTLTDRQVAEIQRQVRQYLDGTSNEIDIINIRQIQEVFTQFRLALQQQEQRLRSQLTEKHSLVEKPQAPAAESSPRSQRRGEKGPVGEAEAVGFGGAERHKTKPKKAKDVSVGRKEGAVSPTYSREADTAALDRSNPLLVSQRDLNSDEQNQGSQGNLLRTDPLPPKAEAFEDFKAEHGSEITCILKENKAVLRDRQQRLRELRDGINATKREIDLASSTLQLQQQRHGIFVTVEGQPVMEEEELTLVLRLRELKVQYRQQHEELGSTRSEVNYCQHLVDQCRIRLLTEFESWYNESFLLTEEVQAVLRAGGSIPPGLIPVEKALNMENDRQDPFEHLRRELLADEPGALPYYTAHNRVLQRRTYR
ncbi:kinesin-like protein KIF9 [Brienomyrus brachyistius]|uniref:kinesin-like protein KIF9 n=1 Tax=Brienomyrus brachyistius TaxID=42636 RepID=UPI0020B39F89|nr:kinesin-like protein KIF9 [Brienomyrus brachyistius]